MNKIVLGISVILLIGAYFFFLNNQKKTLLTPSSITPILSPTTAEKTELESGGNNYRDQNDIYTFVYPNDYTLDTQDPVHIRIYKRGETQRPQSEMSDGALMVFEPIELQGTSLETWVDTRIQESTKDGTSEITEPKIPITQNGYPGFYYAIRGLGTSQNYILQKDRNSDYAVMITNAISDPEQRGYQKEVDAVLRSLKFIK